MLGSGGLLVALSYISTGLLGTAADCNFATKMRMNEKIFIVEEDPTFRRFLAHLLRSTGYEPIGIRSGEEAITRAASEQPALILLDIRLPGMDGTETAAAIKQNPDTSQIPIVALSTYVSKEWQQKAFDAGIRTYLTKTVPPQTIRETIKLIMAGQLANRQRFSSLCPEPDAESL